MRNPCIPPIPVGRMAATLLLLAVVGCGAPSAEDAQSEGGGGDAIAWEAASGPYGGSVEAVLVGAEARVYAGTENALYWRRPADTAWVAARTGTNRDDGFAPLVMGAGGTLFAGGFRSTEGDTIWNRATNDIRTEAFGNAVADVTLLAGFEDAIYAAVADAGLARWDGSEVGWQAVLPLSDGQLRAVARSPEGTLFASGRNGMSAALFRSTDGVEWTEAAEPPAVLHDLAVTTDGVLVAVGRARVDGERTWRVFESENDGDTWRADEPPQRLIRLVTDADGTVYGLGDAGAYRRTNTGWDRLLDAGPAGPVWDLAADGEQLVAGTRTGVVRSTDGGATWSGFDRGLTATSALDLVTGSGAVFAVTQQGVYVSQDDGRTWHAPPTPLRVGRTMRDLAVTDDGRLLAALPEGVFSRPIDGQWTPVDTAGPAAAVRTLAVASDGTLLAGGGNWGAHDFDHVLYRLDGTGLEPVDGLPTGGAAEGLEAGADGFVLLLMEPARGADRDAPVLYRSTDNGATWAAIRDTTIAGQSFYGSMDVGPDGACFLTASRDLYRAPAPCDTWSLVSSDGLDMMASPTAVVAGPGGPYIDTPEGPYRWAGDNEAWRPLGEQLAAEEVYALGVTPNGHLLAATPIGVFRSQEPMVP